MKLTFYLALLLFLVTIPAFADGESTAQTLPTDPAAAAHALRESAESAKDLKGVDPDLDTAATKLEKSAGNSQDKVSFSKDLLKTSQKLLAKINPKTMTASTLIPVVAIGIIFLLIICIGIARAVARKFAGTVNGMEERIGSKSSAAHGIHYSSYYKDKVDRISKDLRPPRGK